MLLLDSPTVTILGTTQQRQALDSQGRATTGIFAASMPESAVLPAIVFTDIHSEDTMTMDGPDPFTMTRMQFSCYGATYADAKHLARAIRNLFENFQGTLADQSQVDSMRRIGEVDAFEDAPFSYAAHVDFEIAYRIDPGAPYVPPAPIFSYTGATTGPRRYAITGTRNGVNMNFTLPGNPDPAVLVILWNGMQMNPDDSYTLGAFSGGVTPLTTGFAPNFGDDFYAIF